jgi:pyrimidine-nucleoside phosphorylase
MDMVEIIEKKRDGEKLSKQEIDFFIDEYATKQAIPDYQASALLMAIYYKGMDEEETFYLTDAMIKTGSTLDFSGEEGIYVDKHSTGGVGDKVSIILAPILAACGLKLAKMSGRGLGFTGGTLDKLEAIPNFQVQIPQQAFFDQVRNIGLAIIAQSNDMVLADKKLYALRDVTGTVESLPLISSSIMSKKIASGAKIILLDVKFGDGAFMPTLDSARELAIRMKDIGEKFGRTVHCEITSMDDVLGNMVGNALEIKESIDALRGNWEPRFRSLIYSSATTLLIDSGVAKDAAEANTLIDEAIYSGRALMKLEDMIGAQGGDTGIIADESRLNISPNIVDVVASESGYIGKVHAKQIGILSAHMGAGRITMDDKIDHSVGIEVLKKFADEVQAGDVLCRLYHKLDEPKLDKFIKTAKLCFEITDERKEFKSLVVESV